MDWIGSDWLSENGPMSNSAIESWLLSGRQVYAISRGRSTVSDWYLRRK